MDNKVFAERLKSARKIAMLSQEELSTKLDSEISKQAISKYEKGQMLPSVANLGKIARALKVDLEYFFQKKQIELAPIEFRKKSTTSQKFIASIEEQAKYFLERYIDIEDLLQEHIKFKSPIPEELLIQGIDDNDSIERAAMYLREKWNLGEDPIKNVIELLEDQGVKVFELEGDEKFDGLATHYDHNILIVVNKNFDFLRKRFTLLHELAHIVLHINPSLELKAKEIICHKFAGAVLMPKNEFIKEIGERRTQFTIKELENLSLYFGSSIQAIVKRLQALKMMDDYLVKNFFINWTKKGFRKEEPHIKRLRDENALDSYNEHATRFEQLVYRGIAEENISLNKAASLLNVDLKTIRDYEVIV
jgi:Zn-dependent peptidase ImmA (M78 family)/DNA-binding XRE family transcriptional regulator